MFQFTQLIIQKQDGFHQKKLTNYS